MDLIRKTAIVKKKTNVLLINLPKPNPIWFRQASAECPMTLADSNFELLYAKSSSKRDKNTPFLYIDIYRPDIIRQMIPLLLLSIITYNIFP